MLRMARVMYVFDFMKSAGIQRAVAAKAAVISQRCDFKLVQITAEGLTSEISQYHGAVTSLQTKLTEAYAG
ncbi:MAG TPA: hypothetical protein VFE51_16375 [Verrucomicrobiae bacterium]|nr:hypothetical protein [Verrucomicrobiae bacterium]